MPGPFPERTVEAVEACARALGASDDIETTLARSDAATVSALRAEADRAVLRARHEDAGLLARHCPEEAESARAFAALESARLDALGVTWLAGVARNLLAHPGKDEDGVRWLAFEVFTGREAPPEKRLLADAVRRALPGPVLAGVTALAEAVPDAGRFTPASATVAAQLAPYLARRTGAEGPRVSLPVRLREEWRRKAREAAAGGDRPRERRGGADPGGGHDGGAGLPDAPSHPERYRAFTTAHDRVVHAASLVARDELARLRARLDAEAGPVRAIVARLAKRLMRILMARQVREWRFDQDEGQLDPARLAPFVASSGATRPFRHEAESRFPDTVVTLLIDHSGSMRGRPMLIAGLTVEVFARVLERCGVRCEVLGFTTRDWDGGAAWRDWADQGYPEAPGRLNALEHIVIKEADAPWRRARAGLGLFLHDECLKENIDGEALEWAHGRLLARTEARRILIVVSDGSPMDEATSAANDFEYLDRHLRAVVERIETRSPVQLAAIGIGHDVSLFYRNATRIGSIDDLGPALSAKLMSLLDPDAPALERSGRRRG